MNNNDLIIIQDHIRIGKGMGLTNGVPEALERLVERLQQVEKAYGLVCDVLPPFPSSDPKKEWYNHFLNEAKQMLADEKEGINSD